MSARPAPDVISQIKRMQEEIRQLRLRVSGGGGPGAWQSLIPFLTPGWAAIGAWASPGATPGDGFSDINDTTKGTWPRWYQDRDRIYLGGAVRFNEAAWTGSGYLQGLIYTGHTVEAGREQQVVFQEDTNYSSVGMICQTGYVLGGALAIITGDEGYGLNMLDGTVLGLDHISYRISA